MTGLWLADTDHMTRTLGSHWPHMPLGLNSSLEKWPEQPEREQPQSPSFIWVQTMQNSILMARKSRARQREKEFWQIEFGTRVYFVFTGELRILIQSLKLLRKLWFAPGYNRGHSSHRYCYRGLHKSGLRMFRRRDEMGKKKDSRFHWQRTTL